MRATTILCHPFERSFCRALADAAVAGAAEAGAQTVLHDLYAEAPDPVLTGAEIARRFSLDDAIRSYSDEVVASGLITIVHPDWWSGPPALLKGWIERVLRPGVAYEWRGEEFTEKVHVPLLGGRRLVVLVTTDRGAESPPAPLEGFWRDVCAYCGLDLARYTLYPDLRHSGIRQRRSWLAEARKAVMEATRDD